MLDNPLVSIIIPTHNRKEMVKRLLRSIFNSSYKNVEVVVVDDASGDGTTKYLNKFYSKNKKIKIITNEINLFTAGSRNIGLKIAKGELIFFVDDDNVLDKFAIEELVKVFLTDSTVGEAGPVNYNWNNKNQVLFLISKRNMWTTRTYQPRSFAMFRGKAIWETDDIPNAFMVRSGLVRKNKIFFKEEFGIMYEESDIAYRIRKLGFKIMVSKKAKIYHDIEVSEKGKKKKDYMYHFMEDKRRLFVFARNRIIFHSLYSTKPQLIGILLFWVWFFAIYYIYKILFYSSVGNTSLIKKLNLAFLYIAGILEGLRFVFSRKKIY